MTGAPVGLGLVIFSVGYDRVHYALAMAAAAAASVRRVTLLVTGRALPLLLAPTEPDAAGWYGLDPADDGSSPQDREQCFAARGVATLEELLTSCAALGVAVTVCEMGLRALNLSPATALRLDIPATLGGIVGFLGAVGEGSILFV